MKKYRICFYIIIFAAVMAIVSAVMPWISDWAMLHRESGAPGGEVLLWLVPFMAVVVVDTAKISKSR